MCSRSVHSVCSYVFLPQCFIASGVACTYLFARLSTKYIGIYSILCMYLGFFLACMLHSYISQIRCSGPWHVHAVFHDHPRAILDALPRTTLSVQRCRSSLFCSRTNARQTLGKTRHVQDTTTYRRSVQISFSRSQVHVCLHALLVPLFRSVPGH